MTQLDEAVQALRDTIRLIEGSQDSAERGTILAQLLMKHRDGLIAIYRTDPATFSAFLLRVRGIRGMAATMDTWVRPIKQGAKEKDLAQANRAQADANTEAASLDALTDDLGLAGLLSPIGYRVDQGGIWEQKERIALEPVVLTGVTRDLETDALRWDLAWRWRGRWWKRSVERDVALDGRRLQRLAEYGLPVHSDNASKMVRYLAVLEATNLPLVQERATTGRLGWLSPRVFQLGEQCLGSDTVLVADGGLKDLAGGWKERGEWKAWHAAIRRHLRRRPLVQLAIYAAAVAPLLRILELDGFVVDWSGATSRGKTSALRVAASVWGDPEKLVGSWGTASVVGPQEAAAFLHSLPLILDDTKRVGDRGGEIVARMLYDLPAGRERLRGQAGGGLRRVKTWRTVLLSTGEKAVTDFSEDAGARARSLCIRGAPFGKDSTENRKSTEALATALRAHHGHLGRKLMDLIIARNYDGLRDRYHVLRDQYAEQADGSVSRRLGAAVAALHLAGELCHELGCPGKAQLEDTMEVAWDAALQGGMDSDRPAAAWRALWGWITANAERFDGARRTGRTEGPTQGWAGKWDRDSTTGNWTTVAIYPQLARDQLERWGFDRDYCLNEWARRGWLDAAKGRRTKKVRVGGSQAWLFAFQRKDVAELLAD